MKNLLHIDTSIQASTSTSRRLSAAIVARINSLGERFEIKYRDLASNPLPHLSGPVFAAFVQHGERPELTSSEKEDVAISEQVLAEFLAADTIVIGVAFYNFSIPSPLKAWIDRVVVAGKTFTYGHGSGPVGLAAGKRVIVAIARGGYFSDGTPNAQREHAERYLRDIFALVGITNIEVVVAEGLGYGPEASAKSVTRAMDSIHAMRASVA